MNETKKPYNHHAHNHQLGVERIDFSFAGWLLLHKISIHWLNIKARKRIIKYIVCSHISHWPVNFNDDVIRIFSSWFFSRKNNLISLLQGFLLFFIFIFYFFGNLGETVLEKQKKKRLITTWTTCVCDNDYFSFCELKLHNHHYYYHISTKKNPCVCNHYIIIMIMIT